MSHYLLSVHSSTDSQQQPGSPEEMRAFMQRVVALEAEMDASETFVFGGRLADSDASTVIRSGDGGPVLTDGPFVEAKEHIAGFYIIAADDLDAALAWAGRVTATIGAPIEVRPFVATGRVADQVGTMHDA